MDPMEKTDNELIDEYKDGSQEALKTLISRHIKRIYQFTYRMTGSAEDANDITQETFIKAWKHLGRYNPKKKFVSWLLAIARNTALDSLKKKKAVVFSALNGREEDPEGFSFEDTLADIEPLQDEVFGKKEADKVAEKALAELPLHFRDIIILHVYQELTFQEIAEMVKKPLNTVKSLYRRGLIYLKKNSAMHQKG